MEVARLVATVLVLPTLALGAVACSSDPPRAAAHLARSTPTPGGPSTAPDVAPTEPMSPLEQAVSARLRGVARQHGLRLEHLRCPAWDHRMPGRVRCAGWFSGVRADVLVRLTRVTGGSLLFDAWIGDGVVATRQLVRRLEQRGQADVDCGNVPAYPARVGLRIVCASGPVGQRHYWAATVTNRSGAVRIVDA